MQLITSSVDKIEISINIMDIFIYEIDTCKLILRTEYIEIFEIIDAN